ncbi:MAG TPA: phage tail protein [Roseovarius sp.]|nr:phage tail protein [Roseovarius sp.]
MTPDFRIIAGGTDTTAIIRDRLLSLTVVDGDEERADRLTLELDARDARVELPETGEVLEVSLGFRETGLVEMGRFTVDGLKGRGPALTLTVEATAADMTGPLRAPRSTAWEDKTLGDIAGAIAARGGLTAAVSPRLAGIHIAYEAQTAESDLAFLTRLAERHDATAKPAGGRLVITPRDRGEAADGSALPSVPLSTKRLQGWDWDIVERQRVGRVEAEWRDVDTGTRDTVTAGEGDPVHRLRHVHSSEEEARRAAEAKLRRAKRGKLELNARLAGFEPALFAGGNIAVSGVYPGIDGTFLVKRVEHRLAGALTTQVRAQASERGGANATGP